jgi:biotin transport system substrate-specific component
MTRTNTSDVDLVDEETTVNIARAALFAALMGAFALVAVTVPFTSIPFTLQVLGVFLAGIMLGPVWGGAAMVLYLAAGAVGAPVFSGGSAGIGILLGGTPRFGYLWAFPLAAVVIGYLVHGSTEVRRPSSVSPARLVVAMAVGTVVIYAFGALGLMYVQDVGPEAAVLAGVVPFVPAEILKLLAALGIVRSDVLHAG